MQIDREQHLVGRPVDVSQAQRRQSGIGVWTGRRGVEVDAEGRVGGMIVQLQRLLNESRLTLEVKKGKVEASRRRRARLPNDHPGHSASTAWIRSVG